MRKAIMPFLFLLVIGLSACTGSQLSVNSDIQTEQLTKQRKETAEPVNDDTQTMDILHDQGTNYEVYTDSNQTGYLYYVKDNNSNLLDRGYHNDRGSFGFSVQNNLLILNYGVGGPTEYTRYYDTSSGRVSRFFEQPIAASKELVAYFAMNNRKEIVLIVRNMFDPERYYREFGGDFSNDVFKTKTKGAFSEDQISLTLTYRAEDGEKTVTKTIDLR